MNDLSIEHFPDFFREITGHPPFGWQERLAREVHASGWPDVLDLPTAAGKTATLEVAVFTLALESSLPSGERTAPRRIFFVVDRRVVVDQAFDRARNLAEKLGGAAGGAEPPMLRRVAARLQELAGPGLPPLGYERLRGGVPRNHAWTRAPSQPAIIASTVDQVGSRLLFRGYGVKTRMAPVHAALVGNDALILLDEAHCAVPFLQTISRIQQYRHWGEKPPSTPFHAVALSATTPKLAETSRVFSLSPSERAEPELDLRLTAAKPAELLIVQGAKIPRGGGREEEVRARSVLARAVAERALRYASEGRERIAVIVNRVATAIDVRDRIARDLSTYQGPPDERLRHAVLLMTGRLRPLDRDDLITEWQEVLRAAPDPKASGAPVIVVSTQSLEVGADFDFDALVTEAASLDALRQRFGRVNRLGRSTSVASIIIAAYQAGGNTDPIYGEALGRTWSLLERFGNETRGRGPDGLQSRGSVDFGVDALDRLLANTPLEDVTAPFENAPVLLPAHLDRWVQTSPAPEPDPDPGVFLHGWDTQVADVEIVFRADLSSPASTSDVTEALTLCLPSSVEAVPLSIGWARHWLKGRTAVPAAEADVEGRVAEAGEEPERSSATPVAFVWREGKAHPVLNSRFVRPGDVLVAAADHPGSLERVLQWDSDTAPILDQGDRAQFVARGRALLRLHPDVVGSWPESIPEALREELIRLASKPLEEHSREDLVALLQDLRDAARAGGARAAAAIGDIAEALLTERFSIEAYPLGGIVLRGRKGAHAGDNAAEQALRIVGEEQDEPLLDSSSEGQQRFLYGHQEDVGDLALLLSMKSGIGAELGNDLALAGRYHDLGKADERFQGMLRGDGLPAVLAPEELLAKSESMPASWSAYRRLADAAGLPHGFRHELVSMALIKSSEELLQRAHDRDLVLHLIASHHGYCRPFAPVVADEEPTEIRLPVDGSIVESSTATGAERLGSGVAERFWRLVRRHGWWGLAYLEAIVRTADHLRSAAARGSTAAADGPK